MKTPLHSLLFGVALALVGAAVSLPAQGHDPQAQRLSQHGSMAKARFARAVRNHPELAVAVDLRRLEMDMADPRITAVIEQDLADAQTLGVRKTPGFFVNGKPLEPFGERPLAALVEAEVRAQYPQ